MAILTEGLYWVSNVPALKDKVADLAVQLIELRRVMVERREDIAELPSRKASSRR